MGTQTNEIEAWLGDDHGLTDDQVEQLRRIAEDIYARYCTPDPGVDDPGMVEADLAQASEDERQAALAVAYRLLAGEDVVSELARDLADARAAVRKAMAGLWQAALMTVDVGERGRKHPHSENAFAQRVGVDRATVRKWLGKGTQR
jgi:hypothetical protein